MGAGQNLPFLLHDTLNPNLLCLSPHAIGAAGVYFLFNLDSPSSVVLPCPPHFTALSSSFLSFSLPFLSPLLWSLCIPPLLIVYGQSKWKYFFFFSQKNLKILKRKKISTGEKKCYSLSHRPDLSTPHRFRTEGGVVARALLRPKSERKSLCLIYDFMGILSPFCVKLVGSLLFKKMDWKSIFHGKMNIDI